MITWSTSLFFSRGLPAKARLTCSYWGRLERFRGWKFWDVLLLNTWFLKESESFERFWKRSCTWGAEQSSAEMSRARSRSTWKFSFWIGPFHHHNHRYHIQKHAPLQFLIWPLTASTILHSKTLTFFRIYLFLCLQHQYPKVGPIQSVILRPCRVPLVEIKQPWKSKLVVMQKYQ